MINISSVKVGSKVFSGIKVDLPESPPLVLIIGEKGFVMCGFLNAEAAEKFSVAAAVVSGVKSFEDVLNAQVGVVTSKAKGLGVEAGMKGSEALKHLS